MTAPDPPVIRIAAIVWVDRIEAAQLELAPLTRDHVLVITIPEMRI